MNENARRWVKALRSRDFQQGVGKLFDGERYCCLGVACELFWKETPLDCRWEPFSLNIDDKTVGYTFHGEVSVLPEKVREWLGLNFVDGQFDNLPDGCYEDGMTLIRLNDEAWTFKQIADFMESEPVGLFEEE